MGVGQGSRVYAASAYMTFHTPLSSQAHFIQRVQKRCKRVALPACQRNYSHPTSQPCTHHCIPSICIPSDIASFSNPSTQEQSESQCSEQSCLLGLRLLGTSSLGRRCHNIQAIQQAIPCRGSSACACCGRLTCCHWLSCRLCRRRHRGKGGCSIPQVQEVPQEVCPMCRAGRWCRCCSCCHRLGSLRAAERRGQVCWTLLVCAGHAFPEGRC